MEIRREDVREAADAVLRFFEKKNITSLQDITRINYIMHPVDDAKGIIYVQKTPSEADKTAQSVSYVLPKNGGLPLDIKIHEKLGYVQVILKTLLHIPNYEPFVEDRFGNNVQTKVIFSTDLTNVVKELEQLAFRNED